jgi:hypothetical protein
VRVFIATFALLLAGPALAGLGEPVDSIDRDHSALHATARTVTPGEKFDLHEIATAHGTRVREYATKSGTVFAVAWDGPVLPDLKVVLGARYADFLAAAANNKSRRVLSVSTQDFVINAMKRPRGFVGAARIPSLVPEGTSAAELR